MTLGRQVFVDRRLRLLLTALVAFAAAFGGMMLAEAIRSPPVEERLLDRIEPALKLSPAQAARIDARRARFERRRLELERAIAARDRDLADAIDAEHRRGPRVRAAVRAAQEEIFRLHDEQIDTLLGAREELTPAQTRTFDRLVRRALTTG